MQNTNNMYFQWPYIVYSFSLHQLYISPFPGFRIEFSFIHHSTRENRSHYTVYAQTVFYRTPAWMLPPSKWVLIELLHSINYYDLQWVWKILCNQYVPLVLKCSLFASKHFNCIQLKLNNVKSKYYAIIWSFLSFSPTSFIVSSTIRAIIRIVLAICMLNYRIYCLRVFFSLFQTEFSRFFFFSCILCCMCKN